MDPSASASGIKVENVVRDRASLKALRNLAVHLRRGTISEAENVANATAKALRSVVSAARFSSLNDLILIIRTSGAYLQDAQPKEQTIGNITRRILHLLREEARAAGIVSEDPEEASQQPGDGSSVSTPTRQNTLHAHFASSTTTSSAATSPPQSASHSRASSSFQIPLKSFAPGSPGEAQSRPSLSAFRPGSTFSISDLVAAGAAGTAASSATPSSFGASPLGSGATTPAAATSWGNASLERLGYGVEALQIQSSGPQRRGSSGFFGKGDVKANDDDEADDDDDEEEEEDVEGKGVGAKSTDVSKRKQGGNAGIYQLKPLLIQAIQELIDELETVDSNIAKDARDHVHSGEVIFTIGYSRTVEVFLRAAAKDRKFTVIVAEAAPNFSGHRLAKALSSANISTLLVPDSSTFTLMPRISKIVLGAHCILANGGLLTTAGARMVAEAARAHSTPTVVLAGVYKVCPDWTWVSVGTSLVDRSTAGASAASGGLFGSSSYPVRSAAADERAATTTTTMGAGFSSQSSPLDVLDFVEATTGDVEVVNSEWDYVDPDMVNLLITNVGEHPISLVYRLLSENYHAQDLIL